MKYLWLCVLLIIIFLLLLLFLLKPKHDPPSSDKLKQFLSDTTLTLQYLKYGLIQKSLYQVNLPVLYINLDRDKDRKKYMEFQFQEYNIKTERVSAVYGKNLKSLKHSSPGEEISFVNNYSGLSPGEVGCTLSHLKAIRIAYEKGYDMVLIAEDDCCFDLIPFWPHSIEDIVKTAPNDWEILQLSTLNCL